MADDYIVHECTAHLDEYAKNRNATDLLRARALARRVSPPGKKNPVFLKILFHLLEMERINEFLDEAIVYSRWLAEGPFADSQMEIQTLNLRSQALAQKLVFTAPDEFHGFSISKSAPTDPLDPRVQELIETAERGLNLLNSSPSGPNRRSTLAFRFALSRGLQQKCFHPHASIGDIDRTITITSDVADNHPFDNARSEAKRDLALLIWSRSNRYPESVIEDLTRAIAILEDSLSLPNPVPNWHHDIHLMISTLYSERARQRGDSNAARTDIRKSIEIARTVLDSASGSEYPFNVCFILGRRLWEQFNRTKILSDINEAIPLLEHSLTGREVTRSLRWEFQRILNLAKYDKGKATKSSKMVEDAAHSHEKVLDSIPEGHPVRLNYLTDMTTLGKELENAEKRAKVMETRFPWIPKLLRERFRYAWQDEDESAVKELFCMMVEFTAAKHSQMNLRDFQELTESEDVQIAPVLGAKLERAFQTCRTAEGFGNFQRANEVFNQPMPIEQDIWRKLDEYEKLFTSVGKPPTQPSSENPDCVKRDYARELQKISANDLGDRPVRMRKLGWSQAAKGKTRVASYFFQKAVDTVVESNPEFGKSLIALSTFHWHQARKFGFKPVLQPKQEPGRGEALLLPTLLVFLHHILGFAITASRILDNEATLLHERVEHGVRATEVFSALEVWSEAYKAGEKTARLMPDLVELRAAKDDCLRIVKRCAGISALTSHAALKSNHHPWEALELQQICRGLTLSKLMLERPDLEVLRREMPDEHDAYVKLSQDLRQKIRNRASSKIGVEQTLRDQEELSKCEAKIRCHPKLNRFQLPTELDEVRNSLEGESIVSLNVVASGGHALILTKNGVSALELPEIRMESVREKVDAVAGRRRLSTWEAENMGAANGKLQDILEWMWEFVVKPVLDHLGLLGKPATPNGSLPRIYWVTGDYIGLLPIHAAGIYTKRGKRKMAASMFTTSTYTPSIGALMASRRKKIKPLIGPEDRMLLVGMGDAEGVPKLLNVKDELESIKSAFVEDGQSSPAITIEMLGDSSMANHDSAELSTPENVLKALARSHAVHFACHGLNDSQNPLNSSLIVGERRPQNLTVDAIGDLNLSNASLAYLSACVTATIADETTVDENLHLASIFQLIGFPHVIGTLWEVDDSVSSKVAKSFYENVFKKFKESVGSVSHHDIAYAYCDAVEKLQKEIPPGDFLSWVPYVHYGA